MKKTLLITCSILFLISCSASKQIEKALTAGNYDKAIYDAIGKLRTNKDKKNKTDYINLLYEAYLKANDRDLQNIDFLKKDNNPENYIRIYDLFLNLNNRQEIIKPFLPLSVNGKEIRFKLKDYSSSIIKYKEKASEHLYNNTTALLNSKNKLDYRKAYNNLKEIEAINPNYKDVRSLINWSHAKGTDYVLVDMFNDTRKIIPQALESDLLNFSTYGINNLWTVYHNTPSNDITYDYNMRVVLREINVSPEQIKERQIIKEKQIIDGKKNLLDTKGNPVKDSLGNFIKVDNLKTIRCEYYEFKQNKSAQVKGNVEYININTQQLIDAFPIESTFVFDHVYANTRGDKRALDTNLLPFLERRRIPFPTDEQIIYDTGEDLKQQLKQIIKSYNPS
ncbi:hypothetical protein [Siansivirga zeaxanthinifaciens]|uniref:Lipoprotein n=1 Tax=Siansivirga zeaxanthinifaciens CC-SAMT-1 TaxID=1454006 RepID=A0A0C5VXY7_9FLAO|nr:hypothetical protein [Siansivirga zeaxanthinifaciens]AJR03981.1 hypothetical protein AW14_10415 [Siansivirga zeaxanthinifaciens CC-SAMT-1]